MSSPLREPIRCSMRGHHVLHRAADHTRRSRHQVLEHAQAVAEQRCVGERGIVVALTAEELIETGAARERVLLVATEQRYRSRYRPPSGRGRPGRRTCWRGCRRASGRRRKCRRDSRSRSGPREAPCRAGTCRCRGRPARPCPRARSRACRCRCRPGSCRCRRRYRRCRCRSRRSGCRSRRRRRSGHCRCRRTACRCRRRHRDSRCRCHHRACRCRCRRRRRRCRRRR